MNKYKRMIVHFAGVDACEVELCDYNITEMWCDLQQYNSQRCAYWTRLSTISYHNSIIKQQYDEVYTASPELINRAIDRIEELTGFRWPVRAFPGMDFDVCNLLHRMFTTGLSTSKASVISNNSRDLMFEYKKLHRPVEAWWLHNMMNPEFHIDKQYPDMSGDTLKEFLKTIHIVNSEVHRYEDACLISGRSKQLEQRYGSDMNRIMDVAWDEKDHWGQIVNPIANRKDDQIIDELMDGWNTDPEINVFQLKAITGKSYNLAWQQYDDPRYWDISRTHKINGGMTIDPLGMTNRVYNSHEFLNWLDEYTHPRDPKLYGHVPIGCVLHGWGPEQFKEITPYMEFKNVSDCDSQMHSETHKINDPWSVVTVEFEQ
jgi:hypothetical protein